MIFHISTIQRRCDYVTLPESWMIKRNAKIDVSLGDTIFWKRKIMVVNSGSDLQNACTLVMLRLRESQQ